MTLTTKLIVGELKGYRCWEYQRPAYKSQFLLRSLVYEFFWPPNEIIIAKGLYSEWWGDEMYNEGENDIYYCGIHSYKYPDGVSTWIHSPGLTVEHPLIVGTIEMWGEVIEHEEGYRAQYCRITGIDYVVIDHERHDMHDLLSDIQKQYNIGYTVKEEESRRLSARS